MDKSLPEGLTTRPATLADIENIHNLVQVYETLHYGKAEERLDETRASWTGPGLNLTEDSCLVFDRAGQLVGYLRLEHNKYAKFYAAIRILPEYSDPRLGDYLIQLAEKWTRERMVQAEPGTRVTLGVGLPGGDSTGRAWCERAGLREIRCFWAMEIELNEAPSAPVWPERIELRSYVHDRDERVAFRVIDTAFQDHWGHITGRFDEWRHWTIERVGFDPTLWFIAYEGELAVGGVFCSDEGERGWIDDLAVLRPWRGKGLGMALLLYAFGEFYRRGQHRVGLGVDSQNLTGALRLYQRAGMHKAREHVNFEKELRAGAELSTRTLAG